MADFDLDEVKRIVQGELDAALGQDGGQLSQERLEAIRYYNGEPLGTEVEGRSSVVMRSVLEAVEWVLPALLRIFTASDQICVVEPRLPGQEEQAEIATAYLNHIWYRDNDGFSILHDWQKDALLEKTGWLKVWFDTSEESVTKSYSHITEEEFDALLEQDGDVEVLAKKVTTEQLPAPPMPAMPGMGPMGPPMMGPLPGGIGPMGAEQPMMPQTIPVRFVDCTIEVTRPKERVLIRNCPPEEILISRRATRDDIPFLSHRTRRTYSDLIQAGYDADSLDEIAQDDSPDSNQERVARFREDADFPPYDRTDAAREIWVEESYLYLTGEDDENTTDLYKVVTAGKGKFLLTRDGDPDIEPVAELPFFCITPIPMPHKLIGLSLADLTMDLQLVKSTLIRQMLDNGYLSNWPRIEVGDDVANENTYDDILNLRPGAIIRTRRVGGIGPLSIPYTADKTFPLVQYLDETQEVRTGVARHNQGISPDDLNKTATGISLMQQAAAQRVELFARIFGSGLQKVLTHVLNLVRRHQTQQRIIRVTGKFLAVDPTQWTEEMPVTVSVGLGTGNRDQILAYLMQILTVQQQIVMQQGGLSGPLLYPKNVYDVLEKLCENAGFKQPFFADPSKPPDPKMMGPPQQQKPDPAAQAMQAKAMAQVQVAQAKAQSDMAIAQAKAQIQADLDQRQAATDIQIAQIQAQNKLAVEAAQAQADMAVARLKAENEMQVEQMRAEQKAEVAALEVRLKYAAGAYDQKPAPPPNGSGSR